MTIKEFEIQLALGSLSKGDKVKLAGSKRTSKKILTALSKDKDKLVRCWVADNPNAPKEVLEILSKNKDWYIRRWVASNPNAPIEVLKKLSTDEDHYVRWKVAKNLILLKTLESKK